MQYLYSSNYCSIIIQRLTVNLYFDVPPFYDRITKDRSAKFVDMLSAVGGTMGLLTGFSIISGVEVVYFAVKIMIDCMQRKRKIVK